MQLPPKLKYRFDKWRRSLLAKPVAAKPQVGDLHMSEIKKHESQVSFFKSDVIRMDFGAGVDIKTKKMAIDWAKKKGLNIIDETLNKSANGVHTIVFSKGKDGLGQNAKPLKTIIL